MNWDVAHRVASMAAAQAHRDLELDRLEYVDVYAALRQAGVDGMARPMSRLFGVYVSPQHNGPAVLLNANLDIIAQRHTAGHELGHHLMRHGSAFDKELDRATRWGDGSWPDEEKVAEAFAAWFLMPPPAVHVALARIGVLRPRLPEHAYQVARWLGTSYAGTVHHLHRLRLLTGEQRGVWLKAKPAALKASLADGPVAGKAHVHVVAAGAHRSTVRADVGDLIVLRSPGAHFDALPQGLLPADTGQGRLFEEECALMSAAEVTDAFTGTAEVRARMSDGVDVLEITVQRQAPRADVQALWPA
ncbi:ImmA/IrrE family metallo-endopeptidase [Nonomuraea sediminis]|uniref:ImmA/IrrE family metallo-endopeptidase n=1 Tax=Nonomuraea sediminis TaxID=2835864 RepID=UPI001BDC9108|nr:ImmA/IrrE family metallo-endopeptidase [Nonomuraea sediminis]